MLSARRTEPEVTVRRTDEAGTLAAAAKEFSIEARTEGV
jgi:hypothetical protein